MFLKFCAFFKLACLAMAALVLTGCATPRVAAVSDIENTPGAFSVPYSISESGRILLDVSINGGEARPLALDTGASVSVLYGDFAKAANLEVSEETRFVRGLVGRAARPVIKGVNFQIGPQRFDMDPLVMLDTPIIKDEAIGLLGIDVIDDYVALFNRDRLTASLIPRENIDAQSFAGWNRIPLEIFEDADTSARLYFATMKLDKKSVPVLVDTGSNLNFINWKLATLDEEVERLQRKLIRQGTLQGALDTTSASKETLFNDLRLGDQNWEQVRVVIMGLNALETVAPVEGPMMVAGARVFAPHVIAFDLSGLSLYVKPSSN